MNNVKYYVAAISAFFIWGFFSFALKPIDNYQSLDILFYRVFFCTVIMLFLTLFVRVTVLRETASFIKTLSSKERWRLILQTSGAGIFLTANWFFFIYVVNHISIKAASFAYVVSPILTTVLAFIFLKEKLLRIQWLAVGLSGLSCLILALGDFTHVIYSLVTALSFSLYLISQPKNKGLDKFLLLTVQIICSAILLAPFYPRYSSHVSPEFTFFIYITVIAVLFTIIPLFLNLYALKELKSSTLGMLFFINPVMNFLVAVLYYHEKITMLQCIGYAVILISVILFNFNWIAGTGKYFAGKKSLQ